jgi:hypothetical protein
VGYYAGRIAVNHGSVLGFRPRAGHVPGTSRRSDDWVPVEWLRIWGMTRKPGDGSMHGRFAGERPPVICHGLAGRTGSTRIPMHVHLHKLMVCGASPGPIGGHGSREGRSPRRGTL